ncbi:hypothetical protein AAHC03_017026 [Spirometra sp. Aus1]
MSFSNFSQTPPCARRSATTLSAGRRTVLMSCLLGCVIVLQVVIIILISQVHRAQNKVHLPGQLDSPICRTAGDQLQLEEQGNRNELPIRGRLLQLADLLSWDAKCNRLLHDLVVSCYGAPDYVAQAAVGRSKSYKYNRKFPFNLSIPPSQSGMPREREPPADPKRRQVRMAHFPTQIPQEVHETRTDDEYASGRANGSTPTDNEGR